VLLVDDVCTNGSTLRVALDEILRVADECEVVACDVVAATAGQMTVRSAVRRQNALLAS
jgi:pyrimidine operon attenuation protein/uracil phosphoribosyltransferase